MCGQKEVVWSSLLSTGLFLLLLPFCQQQCSLLVSQIRALIQLKNNSHGLHALLTVFLYTAILFKLYCYQCTALQDLPTSQSIQKSLTYVIHSINRLFLAENVATNIGQFFFFFLIFMAVHVHLCLFKVQETSSPRFQYYFSFPEVSDIVIRYGLSQ